MANAFVDIKGFYPRLGGRAVVGVMAYLEDGRVVGTEVEILRTDTKTQLDTKIEDRVVAVMQDQFRVAVNRPTDTINFLPDLR